MGASVRRLMSVMLALCVSLYALEMVVADAYASGGGAPEQDPPQMVAAQLLGPGSTTLPDGGIPRSEDAPTAPGSGIPRSGDAPPLPGGGSARSSDRVISALVSASRPGT